jgi:hypothetical protein
MGGGGVSMTVRKGRPEDNPFRRPMVIVGMRRPAPTADRPVAPPPDDERDPSNAPTPT